MRWISTSRAGSTLLWSGSRELLLALSTRTDAVDAQTWDWSVDRTSDSITAIATVRATIHQFFQTPRTSSLRSNWSDSLVAWMSCLLRAALPPAKQASRGVAGIEVARSSRPGRGDGGQCHHAPVDGLEGLALGRGAVVLPQGGPAAQGGGCRGAVGELADQVEQLRDRVEQGLDPEG